MSIYNVEDMERMYKQSTSTQKQLDMLYSIMRALRHKIEDIECVLSNYEKHVKEIHEIACAVVKLKEITHCQTKTINDIIDHIHHTDCNFEERISNLECKRVGICQPKDDIIRL